MRHNYVVVGGGLVGLAVAYQLLLRRPNLRVKLLEKEGSVAAHQSTRNSGVIHTGIYYKPGSYKALLCTEGRRLLLDFAERHAVSHKLCGKVIVATSAEELERIKVLHQRAIANGVPTEFLQAEQLREREPHVAGCGGLWVSGAGVIDFGGVARALVDEITALGGEVVCNTKVESASYHEDGWRLEGSFAEPVHAEYVINCGGLFSDRLATMFGYKPPGAIIPFRGEYYELREEARSLCKSLIYPVPDPRFPFLGVHFTRRFDDSVECGPNAVLAFAREGYSWRQFDVAELVRVCGFSGFRRLVGRHWKMGCTEMYRSLSKRAFVRALQKLVPDVREADLHPGGAGVRAQMVRPDGLLEEDFQFHQAAHELHVLNAPSPAATSSLAIGRVVVERILGPIELSQATGING